MNTEHPSRIQRLTLDELREGTTPELLTELSREVHSVQGGASVGREIIPPEGD